MSTRIKKADFNDFAINNGGLYSALVRIVEQDPTDKMVVVIDDSKIKDQAFQIAWKQFVERNPEKIVATEQPQDELWEAQQAQAKHEADKAHVVKHANEAAARYYSYWVGERRLVNDDRTQNLVIEEIKKRTTGDNTPTPSAALVDLVVEFLNSTGALRWRPAEPVAVAPEPPLPPRILSDGKPELPLGTTPSSRYSVEQLRDLDRRTREERVKQVRAANNELAAKFKEATPVLEVT